jgi:hypothetical protein
MKKDLMDRWERLTRTKTTNKEFVPGLRLMELSLVLVNRIVISELDMA